MYVAGARRCGARTRVSPRRSGPARASVHVRGMSGRSRSHSVGSNGGSLVPETVPWPWARAMVFFLTDPVQIPARGVVAASRVSSIAWSNADHTGDPDPTSIAPKTMVHAPPPPKTAATCPYDLLCTQSAMPPRESNMPIPVSARRLARRRQARGGDTGQGGHKPRLMTLPSTHHSPSTVNRNAREFTMGTVRLSSAPVSNASLPRNTSTPTIRLRHPRIR